MNEGAKKAAELQSCQYLRQTKRQLLALEKDRMELPESSERDECVSIDKALHRADVLYIQTLLH